MPARKELLEIGGREVSVSNPDKVYFPKAGYTKLDLVRYFLAVADGALVGVRGRPMALKRFVDGAEEGAVLPEAPALSGARFEDGSFSAPSTRLRAIGRPGPREATPATARK